MATILEFRASQESEQKPKARRRRRSAEIVIFPGVRYERWVDEPARPDAETAVARDRLVLAD